METCLDFIFTPFWVRLGPVTVSSRKNTIFIKIMPNFPHSILSFLAFFVSSLILYWDSVSRRLVSRLVSWPAVSISSRLVTFVSLPALGQTPQDPLGTSFLVDFTPQRKGQEMGHCKSGPNTTFSTFFSLFERPERLPFCLFKFVPSEIEFQLGREAVSELNEQVVWVFRLGERRVFFLCLLIHPPPPFFLFYGLFLFSVV